MDSNRPEADLSFVLWILGGIALELGLLMPTMAYLYEWSNPVTYCVPYTFCQAAYYSFPTFPVVASSLILYVIVPILYCTIASCKQIPKRIISPLPIGLWTITIAGIVAEAMLSSSSLLTSGPRLDWISFLVIFAVAWLVALGSAVALGYAQTWSVRWLVGLNESKLYRVTYGVNDNFENIRKAVSKAKFLETWALRQMPHKPELVFKSRVLREGLRIDNLIIIAQDTKRRTLIHGTAFTEELYEIRTDYLASNRLDEMIDSIVGKLGVAKGKPVVSKRLETVAKEFVSQHTRTRFTVAQVRVRGWLQVFKRMDKNYRNALYFTGITWGLADVLIILLHFVGFQFDTSLSLVEANLGFFGLLVAEILLPALVSMGKGELH